MNRVILAIASLAVVACVAGDSFAGDDRVHWKVQVRHRFESSNRDFDKGTANNNYNLLRSRLGVKFTPADDVEAFIQLQDSRVMGEEFSTLLDGSADNFDLHQGFLKISELFKAPLDLKLGRMEVNYGVQRLVGAVAWHNIGRSFDGVILNAHTDRLSLDLFNMVLVDSLMPGDYKDLYFYGAHLNVVAKENHTTNFFAWWQRRQPRRSLNRGTVGAHLKGDVWGISYESDLAYQFGDITPDSLVHTVEAYMVTVKLGYTAKVKARPAVFAAIDYLSGDNDLTDNKYKVFSTLYATNHKFYGFMDYFLNIPVNTYGRGLVDTWGRLKVVPLAKLPMMLDFHYFQAQQDVPLSDGSTSKKFGTEVDFTMLYTYNDNIKFHLGASWFGPGAVFKDKRGTDDSTWFFAMTTFNM